MKAFERAGWKAERQSGSHVHMTKEGFCRRVIYDLFDFEKMENDEKDSKCSYPRIILWVGGIAARTGPDLPCGATEKDEGGNIER